MFYEYLIRSNHYRRTVAERPKEQPLKWALAIVVFVLALSITFAEVGG